MTELDTVYASLFSHERYVIAAAFLLEEIINYFDTFISLIEAIQKWLFFGCFCLDFNFFSSLLHFFLEGGGRGVYSAIFMFSLYLAIISRNFTPYIYFHIWFTGAAFTCILVKVRLSRS